MPVILFPFFPRPRPARAKIFDENFEMSINPILSETTLEFMLGQDEIFVRAKIQREFEYFDELNIIHNERSEF